MQIEKYTVFSRSTGITQTNQVNICDSADGGGREWLAAFLSMGLSRVTEKSFAFVRARNWQSFDTLDNLALALCSEAGELAEVVAWKGDVVASSEERLLRARLAQELADIVILLVRLVRVNGIEVAELVQSARLRLL